MTTSAAPTCSTPALTHRPTFGDAVRSEAIKLVTLPSALLGLAGILAVGLGGALFLGVTLESSGVPSIPSIERTMDEMTKPAVLLGQIIAGILGVMAVGSEYSSGSIRTTLMAVPARRRVLWAKALVLFTAVSVTALVTVVAAWAANYPFYAEHGLQAPLTAPAVLPALLGAGFYLGLCAVFGVGLGFLVRSTTVGSILVFGVTLLGPILVSLLPYSLASRVLRLAMLGSAGDSMARAVPSDGVFLDLWGGYLSREAGWLLALLWVSIALAAGATALQKRDA